MNQARGGAVRSAGGQGEQQAEGRLGRRWDEGVHSQPPTAEDAGLAGIPAAPSGKNKALFSCKTADLSAFQLRAGILCYTGCTCSHFNPVANYT